MEAVEDIKVVTVTSQNFFTVSTEGQLENISLAKDSISVNLKSRFYGIVWVYMKTGLLVELQKNLCF